MQDAVSLIGKIINIDGHNSVDEVMNFVKSITGQLIADKKSQ